jgi:hypothetical protein
MYVAEGLADDRIAIIHKVHHVLADGTASANQMAKAIAPQPPSGVVGMFEEPDIARTSSALLTAAARDHIGLIRKLPRLVNETATGISRVRRRSKERGEHPDLAKNFSPPDCFINHVVTPGRRFATAPWRWTTCGRSPTTSASPSTTSSSRWRPVRCASYCFATTARPMSR